MEIASTVPPNTAATEAITPKDVSLAQHGSTSLPNLSSTNSSLRCRSQNTLSHLPASSAQSQGRSFSMTQPRQEEEEGAPGTIKDDIKMVPPLEFTFLLENASQALILDLRVAPRYAASRIKTALNLCIPTTLLKRPSFNTQKLKDTFSAQHDRDVFSRWRSCRLIAFYDSGASNRADAHTATNLLKKFHAEGWRGEAVMLKNGFTAFAEQYPLMISTEPKAAHEEVHTVSSASSAPQSTVAPVAGGCPMPGLETAALPFFNNIRQNMDLLDGVGQMPVHQPPQTSTQWQLDLPDWLRQATAKEDRGRLISEKFLAIERIEQRRMQDALDYNTSPGLLNPKDFNKVQIAGIERGAQNRYNNIFPYDHSRVHLKDVSAGGNDYINANHIKATYSHKCYIATQAPIPTTFADFWRLIWEQNVRTIVMLTAEAEGGQIKSHPYWHTGNYGTFLLNLQSEELVPLQSESNRNRTPDRSYFSSLGTHSMVSEDDQPFPSQKAQQQSSSTILRQFTIQNSQRPHEPERKITQLHYPNWPDFGATARTADLLALVNQTNQVNGTWTDLRPAPENHPPVLVHCSAGCGRTGTFCTVDSVIDMLLRQRLNGDDGKKILVDDNKGIYVEEWVHRNDVDLIARTVADFRGQRLSMVQNLRQFVLCYESILDWLFQHHNSSQATLKLLRRS